MWSPWRGCRRYSEGCRFCYIHKGDEKRGVDTGEIVKTDNFYAPTAKKKNGEYKMKPGLVYLCFQSDFLIENADDWRSDCWDMIRERTDCHFLFLTKRISRFEVCKPSDWGEGYDNVTVGVSCENQEMVDERLSILSTQPIKHRNIILQPLIEAVNIEPYLSKTELVVVGGEYGVNGRPLRYEWVLDIREQCIKADVDFEFRQCATHFIKDDKEYTLAYNQLGRQAKATGINFKAVTF
jgi:protein gp37